MAEQILPIAELITQNLLNSLNGISVAAGYRQTMKAERYDRLGNHVELNKIVLVEGPWRYAPDQPIQHDDYLQTYHCVAYTVVSEADTTADGTYGMLVAADIKKAVMADFHRGGYAIQTIPLGGQPFDNSDGAGVQVSFDVHYRTLLDSPHEQ